MSLTRRQLLAGVSGTAALTMLSAPARAAINAVQSTFNYSTGTSVTTVAADFSAANTLIAFVEAGNSAPNITDSSGNIWEHSGIIASNAASTVSVYFVKNAKVSASQTFTLPVQHTNGVALTVIGISGAATVTPLALGSQFANTSGSATTITLPSAMSVFDAGTMVLTYVNSYTSGATQTASGYTGIFQQAFNGSRFGASRRLFDYGITGHG